MKYLNNTIATLVMVLFLSSCSTSSKFIVDAAPGTKILTPDHVIVAVADNQGKAMVTISDDEFYAFLLSNQPGSIEYVPFALDYKYKSYVGTRAQEWLGWGMLGGATVGLIVATAALAGGDEDIATPAWLLTCGLLGGGMGMGLPAHFRSGQRNQKNQYKLLTNQKLNNDLPISHPQLVSKSPIREKTVQDIPVVVAPDSSTISSKKIGQRSNKTLKDYGSQLKGTYIGVGKLMKGKEIIESYDNISVVITRIDKDLVLVNVVESNGEPFFPSESRYKIDKKITNSFELTLEGISTAKIKIDKNRSMHYLHPKVNIDGDIYTLSIDGNLKQ